MVVFRDFCLISRYNFTLFTLVMKRKFFSQTGNALTFFIHHLSQHPGIRDRIYDEIVGCANDDKVIRLEDDTAVPDVTNVSYLRACLKESMRYINI